jgi:hypothetical protein
MKKGRNYAKVKKIQTRHASSGKMAENLSSA